jgi:hypothetical protein
MTLRELGSFVEQRINEDIRVAEGVGYDRAISYAQWRRDLHAQLRRDIDERPWAKEEVGNFLRREAALYRDHPDYREWWG